MAKLIHHYCRHHNLCCITFQKSFGKLTALRLGEDRAASLGINLQVLRIKVLVLVAMMTATAISFCGRDWLYRLSGTTCCSHVTW